MLQCWYYILTVREANINPSISVKIARSGDTQYLYTMLRDQDVSSAMVYTKLNTIDTLPSVVRQISRSTLLDWR